MFLTLLSCSQNLRLDALHQGREGREAPGRRPAEGADGAGQAEAPGPRQDPAGGGGAGVELLQRVAQVLHRRLQDGHRGGRWVFVDCFHGTLLNRFVQIIYFIRDRFRWHKLFTSQ